MSNFRNATYADFFGEGEEEPLGLAVPETVPEISDQESSIGASFRLENTVGSWYAKNKGMPGVLTPDEHEKYVSGGYDYSNRIPEDLKDYEEEYAKHAKSDRHADGVTKYLRQQIKDKQTISEGGVGSFLATTFAAMTSPEQLPTYFIPGAILLKGSAALSGSKAALIGAETAVGAGSAATAETILHKTQATRTQEESVYAIAGSAIFAGMITGGIISYKGANKSAKQFGAEIDNDLKVMDEVAEIDRQSIGAAKTGNTAEQMKARIVGDAEAELRRAHKEGNIDEIKFREDDLAKKQDIVPETLTELKHPQMAKMMGWASPGVRLLGSRLNSVRTLTSQLVEDPLARNANQYGETLGENIESQMKIFEISKGHAVLDITSEGYTSYKTKAKESGDTVLSFDDFTFELSKSMRKGDAHVDPSIQSTAKRLRSEVMDDVQMRLDSQDMLARKVTNWDEIRAEDLEGLIDEEDIGKFFRKDGTPKANINQLEKTRHKEGDIRVRDTLVANGKLKTEVRIPNQDKSYLHRLWDFGSIRADEKGFTTKVADWLSKQSEDAYHRDVVGKHADRISKIKEDILARETKLSLQKTPTKAKVRPEGVAKRKNAAEKISTLKKEVETLEQRITEGEQSLEEARLSIRKDADKASQRVINSILGEEFDPSVSTDRMSFNVGSLKQRTLNIPSDIMEDFLERDVTKTISHHVRSVNPALHYKQAFDPSPTDAPKIGGSRQDAGSKAFKMKLKEISDEYDVEIGKADNNKVKEKWRKEKKSVMKDMEALQEMSFDRFKVPENPDGFWQQAGQRLREFNAVTMLGMMTVSAIPDIGNMIARRGLGTFSRDISRVMGKYKAIKMSARLNKKMGISANLQNESRFQSMVGMDDFQAPASNKTVGGKVHRGWDNVRLGFQKATLMNQWDNMWSSMASTSFIDDAIVDAVKMSKGELSQKSIEAYARGGLSKRDLVKIAKQIDDGRDITDGIYIPHIDEWADKGIAEKFKSIIRHEVDNTIIKPGKGDLPLMSKGAVGKFVFQFKSFAFTANQRILMAGLDDFSAKKVSGMMTSIMLGYVAYAAKEKLKNPDAEIKSDYSTVVREGLDRSGLLAYWGDINGMMSKLTTGESDAYRLLGAEKGQLSRYASRNMLGAALGVSAGRVSDLGQITSAIAQGDFTEGDMRAIRRTTIFNNLWATHYGFSKIEEAMGGRKLP